ncbi:MAG TPA: xanthine dehydrogenase family protein subunit M [Candidatus Binatia bacterium]|nr:xanthine dehydrogenase family protein subunit M [Candidatus Binatia bacterium]
MRRFNIVEPRSIEDACKLLASDDEAKLIAGGTALLIAIKHGILLPKTLVNLKKINGAAEISFDPSSGLRIGSLATLFEVESSPVVRQHYPFLATACHVVANIRIRNMATIGGNLAHADSQSDPPAVLVALDASVELTRRDGKRTVKLADFLIGSYETGLARDEILTALMVPPPAANSKGTYLKFTTRSSEDRPCAGVAAWVCRANGAAGAARVVVGAVSPAPVVLSELLSAGQRLTAEMIGDISRRAAAAVDPIDDLRGPADYKRQIVQVLVRRALTECVAE